MKLLRIIYEGNEPEIDLLDKEHHNVYFDDKNNVYAIEKKIKEEEGKK